LELEEISWLHLLKGTVAELVLRAGPALNERIAHRRRLNSASAIHSRPEQYGRMQLRCRQLLVPNLECDEWFAIFPRLQKYRSANQRCAMRGETNLVERFKKWGAQNAIERS
jgi:hypothetical protein